MEEICSDCIRLTCCALWPIGITGRAKHEDREEHGTTEAWYILKPLFLLQMTLKMKTKMRTRMLHPKARSRLNGVGNS